MLAKLIEGYWAFLIPEPEGGYTALVPDLPGCATVGETPEEVFANLQEVIPLWLEATEVLGEPIPEPSSLEEARRKLGKLICRELTEEAQEMGLYDPGLYE